MRSSLRLFRVQDSVSRRFAVDDQKNVLSFSTKPAAKSMRNLLNELSGDKRWVVTPDLDHRSYR